MDPLKLRQLGRTQVMLPQLGFGAAGLGNIFDKISEEHSAATVSAAWDAGIRYFDTSPWYGRGLSEHRIGQVLYTKNRAEFVVSTKVGRILTPPTDAHAFAQSERAWKHGMQFAHHFDYSYDGVMRSYEDSLQRLRMNRLDLLIIHDLDRAHFISDALVGAHLATLATSGMRALEELKAAGLISAIGAGVNRVGTIPPFLDMLDIDFLLVALPYTLADQPALDTELARCEERHVGIIIGAPLASGILATGAVPGARLNYRAPTAQEVEKINRIEAVCRSFGVPLPAAALQFPLHHPLVAAVIPGAFQPEQVAANVAHMRHEIPDALWSRLKEEKLIRADAPTP